MFFGRIQWFAYILERMYTVRPFIEGRGDACIVINAVVTTEC